MLMHNNKLANIKGVYTFKLKYLKFRICNLLSSQTARVVRHFMSMVPHSFFKIINIEQW